jgi:hypothetical protein
MEFIRKIVHVGSLGRRNWRWFKDFDLGRPMPVSPGP